jgi:hypothetical protein
VSVLEGARPRLRRRLFERAVMHARNEGVELMFIHALSENTAMLKIARNAGATLERAGSETEAYLRLPPATLDSRVSEMVGRAVGADRLPAQAAGQELLGLPGQRAGDPRAACRAPAPSRPLSGSAWRSGARAARAIRYPCRPPTTCTPAQAVSDPHPARPHEKQDKRTFLQKVAEFIHPGTGLAPS